MSYTGRVCPVIQLSVCTSGIPGTSREQPRSFREAPGGDRPLSLGTLQASETPRGNPEADTPPCGRGSLPGQRAPRRRSRDWQVQRQTESSAERTQPGQQNHGKSWSSRFWKCDELLQRGPAGSARRTKPFHGRGPSSPTQEHAFSSNQKNPESH